ncbi:hypothetical protein GCM10020256_39370 [Streptomyces thermocoprophilus]
MRAERGDELEDAADHQVEPEEDARGEQEAPGQTSTRTPSTSEATPVSRTTCQAAWDRACRGALEGRFGLMTAVRRGGGGAWLLVDAPVVVVGAPGGAGGSVGHTTR